MLLVNRKLESVRGGVLAPNGFKAASVFCDIRQLGTGAGSERKQGKPDLTLIVSERPASVAGMFTTNQIKAAPVKWCIQVARLGVARAILANSGNANACTGPEGEQDTRRMATKVATLLGCRPEEVLICSTGRIGVRLPIERIEAGIEQLPSRLRNDEEAALQAAEAIMTSDTRPKQYAVRFRVGRTVVHVGGIAKGAGMIHPGMSPDGGRPPVGWGASHATMLAFLTTDIAVDPRLLSKLTTEAVGGTFNRIIVDGDMSTNDTVLVLANGAAGTRPFGIEDERNRAIAGLRQALFEVCGALAEMIVDDGEGVHRRVLVRVEGARSNAEADLAARTICRSPLVKASWHGGDPNWGRIIGALGYSSAAVDPNKVSIGYRRFGCTETIWVVRGGRPSKVSFGELCAAVASEQFEVVVRLGLGKGSAIIYTADLTEEYVSFNKGNPLAPETLGG